MNSFFCRIACVINSINSVTNSNILLLIMYFDKITQFSKLSMKKLQADLRKIKLKEDDTTEAVESIFKFKFSGLGSHEGPAYLGSRPDFCPRNNSVRPDGEENHISLSIDQGEVGSGESVEPGSQKKKKKKRRKKKIGSNASNAEENESMSAIDEESKKEDRQMKAVVLSGREKEIEITSDVGTVANAGADKEQDILRPAQDENMKKKKKKKTKNKKIIEKDDELDDFDKIIAEEKKYISKIQKPVNTTSTTTTISSSKNTLSYQKGHYPVLQNSAAKGLNLVAARQRRQKKVDKDVNNYTLSSHATEEAPSSSSRKRWNQDEGFKFGF